MPKASPMVRSFNAGVFSTLMEGRTDHEKYPASQRQMLNWVAAPQGPAIPRSGTQMEVRASNQAAPCALVPFIFSNEQVLLLEFTGDRIRFLSENGIQVYDAETATVTSAAGDPIEFTSADLDANIGDEVVMVGFPVSHNLNGEVGRITAKTGDDYTLDLVYPSYVVPTNGQVARVYHVPCVYTAAQLEALREIQSVDVLYLLTGARPRKLSRYGDYDWRLENVKFIDGPFMPVNETATTLAPSGNGNAIPNMSNNTTPSGVCFGSSNRTAITATYGDPEVFNGRQLTYDLAASEYYYAFSPDDREYWADDKEQGRTIQYIGYQAASPFICDGYVIYAALDNQDTSYLNTDYAPSTFELQGSNDGSTWTLLDRQEKYILYDNNKSQFFEIDNTTSYSYYRLRIFKLVRNGLIEPRVRRFALRSTTSKQITFTASSTVGINKDEGFKSTDVGRLLRVRGAEGTWRSCEITSVTNSTTVVTELQGEPLLNSKPIKQWRLGYWSDTTGWPVCGDFFDDRLFLAGPEASPDNYAGSVVGAYETFSQTDPNGAVLDDNAIVGNLNARKLSRIRWLSADTRGLILGTGSEEWTISAPENQIFTAKTAKARPATRRGSANVEPVRIDNQVVYVQRSRRTVRELAYVYEADSYRSPSMSQLASHLGATHFVEMDYASEPYSIIWMRRGDGSLVGLTYNREEGVIGWHEHDLSGAVIEALACLPQLDQLQDALWVQVAREVNGQTVRYIEKMTPFWDFGMTLNDAHYVDSGLKYAGAPVTTVYGLQHLEGETVYGVADGRAFGPETVVNGAVNLAWEASNVVVGLGFDAIGEISRLENGAADGTAQGKVSRFNSLVVDVWDSATGYIGVYNEEVGGPIYERIEFSYPLDEAAVPRLYTQLCPPITPAGGYEMGKTVFYKRPKEEPLPFNLIAIMPQMNTQDR